MFGKSYDAIYVERVLGITRDIILQAITSEILTEMEDKFRFDSKSKLNARIFKNLKQKYSAGAAKSLSDLSKLCHFQSFSYIFQYRAWHTYQPIKLLTSVTHNMDCIYRNPQITYRAYLVNAGIHLDKHLAYLGCLGNQLHKVFLLHEYQAG